MVIKKITSFFLFSFVVCSAVCAQSNTVTFMPIIDALNRAATSKYINKSFDVWQAHNDKQKRLLNLANIADLAQFKDNELKGLVSPSVDELNKFLKKEGFDIQLEPFSTPDAFGVVSIFDVQVEWQVKGTKKDIMAGNQNKYDGVNLKQGFTVFTSPVHQYPIARIATKSHDSVYMTIADKEYAEFDLLDRIASIKANLQQQFDYDSVSFPMVDLNQQVDIEWLLDMSANSWEITQALQQTKLKMNETGARVQSAVAIAVEKRSVQVAQERVIIDRPFIMWMERSGVTIPCFAGYIDYADWKNPGSLGN